MMHPVFSFYKAVTNEKNLINDGIPQVAFIGRSNVGKSSVINALANNKSLARSSSTPGRTQELNYFKVVEKDDFSKKWYLVDLPGYGFAKGSHSMREELWRRISWYLFESGINQHKIILIVDAKVLPTKDDIEMAYKLFEHEKEVIIVANKIDKLTKNEQAKNIAQIKAMFSGQVVVPFSGEKKIGVQELLAAIAS